jgi:hypothetical protein
MGISAPCIDGWIKLEAGAGVPTLGATVYNNDNCALGVICTGAAGA